ncbi:MAG: DUF1549 domain-containing protein [Pirellulaceae bacterium]
MTGAGVFAILLAAQSATAQTVAVEALPGLVVDDVSAKYEGDWKKSTSVGPYVAEGYQHNSGADDTSAAFEFTVPEAMFGELNVLVSYSAGGNRTPKAEVTIDSAEGQHTVYLDQKQRPAGPSCFENVGKFLFEEQARVVLAPSDAKGVLIVDAVMLLTDDQLKKLAAEVKKQPLAKKADPAEKAETKEEPELEPLPEFEKLPPTRVVDTLTSADIDASLAEYLGDEADAPLMTDAQFLVRATFDLLGRQPNLEELAAFEQDQSQDKRSRAIERMLASEDYGRNWANYWSDVMAYRQQEPQLTFHNYEPLKGWLAEQFNTDKTWDEIVFRMLTARGLVGEHPEGTFIAFHQADEKKLAGETSRVFLSVQIACAECHDHPFVDMPQETFHGMAAFFVRTDAKIPWNDSSKIELVSKDKGEHKMPGAKGEMQPVALQGETLELGQSDLARRAELARWIVAGDNPYFARSYVNHIWGRLMGRGFYDPVDEIGEGGVAILPELHNALADHFLASGCDTKAVVRVVMNTQAYQRQLEPEHHEKAFAAAAPKQLRGDEVFDSLVTAIGLPNVTPEAQKPTGAFRFPPPPKSTRDLVNQAFGYDPSFEESRIVRTMAQAMFMMNNEQIQAQIDADPKSETFLAKLLVEQKDDDQAITSLFRAVLARNPNDRERDIAIGHLKQIDDRGAAFEDLLWSLLNSAEFTTRR